MQKIVRLLALVLLSFLTDSTNAQVAKISFTSKQFRQVDLGESTISKQEFFWDKDGFGKIKLSFSSSVSNQTVNTYFDDSGNIKLGTEPSNAKKVTISFDRSISNLIVPIQDFYAMCFGDCKGNRQRIAISGLNAGGEVVFPEYSSFSGRPDMLFQGENDILVNKAGKEDLLFFFERPVVSVTIETKKEKENDQYQTYLKVGSLFQIKDNSLVAKESLAQIFENCEPIHLTYALDVSNSMSKKEKQKTKTKILSYLSKILTNSDRRFLVSFISFGSLGIVLGLDIVVNDDNIDTGGIIDEILTDKFVNYSEVDGGWTNWKSGNNLIHKYLEGKRNNIVFFMTDGPPNGDSSRRQYQSSEIEFARFLNDKSTVYEFVNVSDYSNVPIKLWAKLLQHQIQVFDDVNLDKMEDCQIFLDLAFKSCNGMKDSGQFQIFTYPNPNYGDFSIQLNQIPEDAESKLVISNAFGDKIHVIHNIKLTNYVSQNQLKSFPSGMYMVSLVTSKGTISSNKFSIVK